MRIQTNFNDRHSQEGPRLKVHVVEGAGNKTPGRIRTLYVDKGMGEGTWIKCDWAGDVLNEVTIPLSMRDKGAFFLQDAFLELGVDGLTGWNHYLQYEASKSTGDVFPDAWLPPKVLELKGAKSESEKSRWKMPEGALGADSDDKEELGSPLTTGLESEPKAKPKGRSAK